MMPPSTMPLSLTQLQKLVAGRDPIHKHVIELLGAMQDDEEEVRAWASDALEMVDSLPRELAESVAQQCLSPHVAVAAWACKLLAKLGSDATHYQAALTACLSDHPSLSVRQQAALALGSIAGLDASAIDALRRAADSDDARLKRLAVAALARAGG